MSLNWQFTDSERFKTFTPEELKQNDCFIWGCMLVDIGEITEGNVLEWLIRYRMYDALQGPFFYVIGKEKMPYVPTLDDVKKRIGLKCNVSTKPRNSFLGKLYRNFSQDIQKEIKK